MGISICLFIYLSIYLSTSRWTISTYKCGRQSLYERLGKTSRTVDPELEEQIEVLPTLDISTLYLYTYIYPYLGAARHTAQVLQHSQTRQNFEWALLQHGSDTGIQRYYCNPGVLCLVGLRLTVVSSL